MGDNNNSNGDINFVNFTNNKFTSQNERGALYLTLMDQTVKYQRIVDSLKMFNQQTVGTDTKYQRIVD